MEFRIADTFTDSLARLQSDEQKAVKTTAFDLQMNPSRPGMQLHKLDHAKDKNFWSVRVSSDIRLIVHKTDLSLLLCYVDHHDKAYQWAERRKIERHPKTGAMQIVEIREKILQIEGPRYVEIERPAPPKRALIIAGVTNDVLLLDKPRFNRRQFANNRTRAEEIPKRQRSGAGVRLGRYRQDRRAARFLIPLLRIASRPRSIHPHRGAIAEPQNGPPPSAWPGAPVEQQSKEVFFFRPRPFLR